MRDHVAAGWRTLVAAPRATAVALLGAATAQLGLRAALAHARQLAPAAWREAVTVGEFSVATTMLASVVLGAAMAGLLATVTKAVALGAYAGRPGVARVTRALITLGAVEVAVLFTLLGGVGLVLLRALHPTPTMVAFVATPPLFLALVFVAATRAATVAAARGATPAEALVAGVDVAMRRLPSLLRLVAWLGWRAVPLIGAAALALVGTKLDGIAGASCQAAVAICGSAVVLWLYASVAALMAATGSSTVVDASRAGAA